MDQLQHFSHDHPLTFNEKEQKNELCSACARPVHGSPSYSCNQCSNIGFVLHKSCAELPREMHHPMHSKHPLVLFPNRVFRCDNCRTNYSGMFSYRCEQCDFGLDISCANLRNMECLEHFSHEHTLICITQTGGLPVVCQGCQEKISTSSMYRCSRILCRYYLHTSCAEMPVEFRHPMHTKHPLILNRVDVAKEYLCDACNKDCSGKFTYSCFQCHFNLDPQCTFTWTNFKHFSHVHPLTFKEGEQKHEDGAAAIATTTGPPIVCSACGDPVLGPSYSCNQCSKLFILHKSCAELQREMHHPIHNKHPLVLLQDRNYCCDICRKSHSSLCSYKCRSCDFELDLQCASDLSNIKYIQHFSHEHALIFVEDPEKREEGHSPVICKGCGERVLGPSYCCSRFRCHYAIHKSCVELPREMHHPIHRKHPLVLLSTRDYSCDICRKSHSGLISYTCKQCNFDIDLQCNFDIDLQCASSLSNIKYLEHFSHEHALIYVEDPRKREAGLPVVCQGCQEDVLGSSYCCSRFLCHYTLHKSCAELPSEFLHPMHIQHPLILNKKGRGYRCDACNEDCSRKFTYSCFQCDFKLDSKCVFNWTGFKYFSHEHPLLLEREPKKKYSSPRFCDGCQESRPNTWPLLHMHQYLPTSQMWLQSP